jgi:hypothetical protein
MTHERPGPEEELVVVGEPNVLPEEHGIDFEMFEPRLEQAATFVDREIRALAERAVQRIQEHGGDRGVFDKARKVMMRSMRGTALALAGYAGMAGMMPATAEGGEPGEGRRKASEIASVILWEGNAELERAYYEDAADLQDMEFAWEQAESEKREGVQQLRQLDEEIARAGRDAERAKSANNANGVFEALERRAHLRAEQDRIKLHLQDREAFQRALERRMEEAEKGQEQKRKLGLAARVGGAIVNILGR